jgi:transmembrane sensor
MNFEKYKTFTAQDFVFDDHFRDILAGKLTPDYSLAQLKEDLPEKSLEIDLAVNIIKDLDVTVYENSDTRKLELWGKVVAKRSREIRLNLLRYTAVVFLVIGSGFFTLFLSQNKSAIDQFASSQKMPLGKEVSLVMSDGEQIDINNKESRIQYNRLGTSILVDDTIRLEQNNNTNGFNQMIVPYGKRSYLLLSDGTQVWINSGSRLVYAPQFTGDTREVFLEGEAYFEVAKDASKPFYVRTDAFTVNVLGTKFNVKAYKDDKEYTTVLVEGKVSMKVQDQFFSKDAILAPNQKMTLIKGQDDFQRSNVDDTGFYTNWIYGYLEFKNANLSDVLKSIQRYYNIDIELNTKGQSSIVSGKLDLKSEPDRVLTGLGLLSHTKIIKSDNKYVVFE